MSDEITNPDELIKVKKANGSSNQDKSVAEHKNSELPQKEEDPSSATSLTIERVHQAFMGIGQSGIRSGVGVLFEKFTEKHIDKYLDYIQRDDDHEYELRKTNRRYYLAYFVIILLTLSLAVIYLLPKDKIFLESIIQILVILAGGIGAGYGLSKRKE